MDQEEFTELLNEDLSTEYQSIVQYNLHISTVTGPEFVSTIDELTKHLSQELNHARVLASQVSFLGGEPTTDVRAVPVISLSGLKTAVRTEASRLVPLEAQDIGDLCASFQAAVLESTADRLSVGLRLFREQFGPPSALVAAGGVAANQAIRSALHEVAAKARTSLIIPPPELCTDNGAMIAWAGAERLALNMIDTMDAPPRARWGLDENAVAPAGFANTRAAY